MATCTVDACEKPADARGLCKTHYGRWWRTGTTASPIRTLEDRFWEKVEKTDTCWLWTGNKKPEGYGIIWSRERQTQVSVHRVSYEWAKGPIPAGLHIDHLCRVRNCVNPEHLEAVTQAENSRRGEVVMRRKEQAASITHCPRDHEYTPENTRMSKRGSRHCLACERARRVA